jgi:hypothetical protein
MRYVLCDKEPAGRSGNRTRLGDLASTEPDVAGTLAEPSHGIVDLGVVIRIA